MIIFDRLYLRYYRSYEGARRHLLGHLSWGTHFSYGHLPISTRYSGMVDLNDEGRTTKGLSTLEAPYEAEIDRFGVRLDIDILYMKSR